MAGKLYTPPRLPGVANLLFRLGIVVALLASSVLIVYFEGGLVDSRTGKHPEFLDCVYFALITITTVGYGDIVPVDTFSRLVDALVLTPIRFLVIIIFLGTAYQLAIKRLQEEYRMKRVVSKLKGHTIVCGFGSTGRAAARELLLQGGDPEQIVVLDTDEGALRDATETGVVVIQGDASRESVLRGVAVDRAANVIISTGRDDTAVLVALTVADLNHKCRLVAMCREEENVKLLERSGAHTIISPATTGGALLAAATRRAHLVETMQDLLDVGGAMQIDERVVRPEEVGKSPASLRGMLVLRVYRQDRRFDVGSLPSLEHGDTIVFIAATEAR